MVEALALDVGYHKVSQVDVARIPIRLRFPLAIHSDSKERQLESEWSPFSSGEVSGVVPPLRLECRVLEMVAREFEHIAGFGLLKGGRRQHRPQSKGDECPLHPVPAPVSPSPSGPCWHLGQGLREGTPDFDCRILATGVAAASN